MRNNHFRENFRVTALVSIFSLIGLSCSCLASFAQTAIAPDIKLPVNTLVNFNNTSKTYTITGGTQVGTTQFHSFQDFSVPIGNTAHFDSVLPTTNVMGRVTGSNISNIDGTLKTNGATNLYLINPNGIIFGAEAKLDIAGSFSASTANSIKFSDGSEFSATNPQAPLLLQVSIPLGLQYGKSEEGATIKSSGSLTAGQDLVLNADKLDLAGILQSSRDLKLQAQDSIKITNGFLSTNSSNVGNAGNITINAASLYLYNSSLNANTFGKANAGNITINVANSIKFDGKSSTQSQVAAQALGNAGNVNITAKTLELLDGSFLVTNTFGKGDAGTINIKVSNSIKFDGKSSGQSQVKSQTAIGSAGSVNIVAKTLELLDSSYLSTNNFGEGNAGKITINVADSIKFDGDSYAVSQVISQTARGNVGEVNIFTKTLELLGGSSLSTSTFGKGNAGNVTINVADSIKFDGRSYAASQVGEGAVGNAGEVSIVANTLELLGGSYFASNTLGRGNAGNITINVADSIKFSGGSYASSLVLTRGVGNSGRVNIVANTLELLGSSYLASNTFGQGNAGNITINVADSIKFDGRSFATSEVGYQAVGNAGLVNVFAKTLELLGGSYFASNTLGQGNAGNITINVADSIKFDGKSSVQSQVAPQALGNAANVKISAKILSFLGDSFLTTITFGKGNAGNITITAKDKVEGSGINSGIITSVETGAVGNAGVVSIDT